MATGLTFVQNNLHLFDEILALVDLILITVTVGTLFN